ncbi:MAG: hypothetical protein KDB03_12725 [Planctomycetales bacterium]|nr:hypothetical protein [Planctomycetales bacterium]
MAADPSQFSPVFRIDVAPEAGGAGTRSNAAGSDSTPVVLLQQILAAQHKQNQLLEQLLQQSVAAQKQRNQELQQWKDANPRLAKACRRAAETLSRVQTEFLDNLTDEIEDNHDNLLEGDFMLNEFVDRFGPRLAHLNGVLQVLAQLGSSNANP